MRPRDERLGADAVAGTRRGDCRATSGDELTTTGVYGHGFGCLISSEVSFAVTTKSL